MAKKSKPLSRKPRVPPLRQLTKAEHIKLGLSPSRKLFVREGVKRLSKSVKTYSNRQGVQQRLGVAKEERTLERKTHVYSKSKHYMNLTKSELHKLIKTKAKGKRTSLQVYGEAENAKDRYGPQQGPKWSQSPEIFSDEIADFIKRMEKGEGFMGYNKNNMPKRFGLIIHG